MSVSVCRKSMFFQKSACSQPLSPNPFPVGRGYFAGATAPRPSKDACSQPHKAVARCNGTNGCQCTDAVAQMADDLYGGYAPKQGCFGCLPKVLHDAKPAEQATLDTPFSENTKVYRQTETGIGIYRCPFFCLLPVES